MPRIAVDGNKTTCGATLRPTQYTITSNGKSVIRNGDPIYHGSQVGKVIRGSSTVIANEKGIAREGDLCICEEHGLVKIVQTNNEVFIED